MVYVPRDDGVEEGLIMDTVKNIPNNARFMDIICSIAHLFCMGRIC